MDTLSHALWGYGLFGYKRYAWLAVFLAPCPTSSHSVLFWQCRSPMAHGSLARRHLPFYLPGYTPTIRSAIVLLSVCPSSASSVCGAAISPLPCWPGRFISCSISRFTHFNISPPLFSGQSQASRLMASRGRTGISGCLTSLA